MNDGPVWRHALCFLAMACGVDCAGAGPPPLQALIDAAPVGAVLRPPAGRYAGPAVIGKSLTLDGGGRVILDGGGRGTVLSVRAGHVGVRGLRLTNSGDSHDGVDAGLLIEADHARVEGNTLDHVLFGIHLKQANHARVRGNTIRGRPAELNLRGDGIRLWNSRFNRIEGNFLDGIRDLTIANSVENLFSRNAIVNGRYGMQLVFSPRNRIEGNLVSHTTTGIAVLYSDQVTLRGNRVEHALSGGGAGIVFKESDDGLVEDNDILHCAAGIKIDAPPEPVGTLLVRRNRFAHNIVGLYFYGEAGGHRFEDNSFENNLSTIAVSAPGAGAKNVWQGNHWDDYQGFDRDGDGIGDTPHEVWLHADRIWMETPMAGFFRNSPGLELLDFLERLAPFSTPHRLIRDPAPRMRR